MRTSIWFESSRNRRAAVERAARKEAEFEATRDAANVAWSRVGKEAAKAGVQFDIMLLTRRGRPASPGLSVAINDYNRALAIANEKQNELHARRGEVAGWDAEIGRIIQRMRQGRPTG
ncbi:MAG: hypothetical protein COW30_02055 [Rhodospirillales bacterium CG15_BIG_FIL_POST_REV_8_21_14_020_66_15]|nr:MAG: hypothetical protein COW30_02055 [Rhodospirillales bacterium CG15_BIG_FIL_POST_REV_8_21_14_020_66_15]